LGSECPQNPSGVTDISPGSGRPPPWVTGPQKSFHSSRESANGDHVPRKRFQF
jgi:hypothetical protein